MKLFQVFLKVTMKTIKFRSISQLDFCFVKESIIKTRLEHFPLWFRKHFLKNFAVQVLYLTLHKFILNKAFQV